MLILLALLPNLQFYSMLFLHMVNSASDTFISSYFSAAKPIDLLAKYVNMTEDDLDIEVQEPYHLLRVGR